MIELKLTQGAKPGHGGVLRSANVTNEIAAARACRPASIASARHGTARSRRRPRCCASSIGCASCPAASPTGFKLCIGPPWESAGLEHPGRISAAHIVRRTRDHEVKLLANLLPFVEPGQPLAAERGDAPWPHNVFRLFWPRSRSDSFILRASSDAVAVAT